MYVILLHYIFKFIFSFFQINTFISDIFYSHNVDIYVLYISSFLDTKLSQ